MSFDKSKPYGEIWGGTLNARFHQNGKYYDHEGNEVQISDRLETSGSQQAQPAAANGAGTAAPDDGAASLAAALAEKRTKLLMQAIPLLERAQAEVIADLPDFDADLLAVMQEVEGMAKKRKAVLEAIDVELAAKKEQADKDAAANGQTVNAPTAQFGTAGAESQLANQLQS